MLHKARFVLEHDRLVIVFTGREGSLWQQGVRKPLVQIKLLKHLPADLAVPQHLWGLGFVGILRFHQGAVQFLPETRQLSFQALQHTLSCQLRCDELPRPCANICQP